jgi:hypothetical protein
MKHFLLSALTICVGDEIGSLENFEIAFGVVMALGAVDDGFTGGVPGNFCSENG